MTTNDDTQPPPGEGVVAAETLPGEGVTRKEKKDDDQATKATLNLYIVAMRKDVNRARIWLTHRITKNIPKFKEKKGTDAPKYHRRAERLVEELQVLKKLHPDEVSKYALCSKLTVVELERQMEKLSTEQRALAKLAIHKLVQDKVKAFFEKYKVKKERVIMLMKALGTRSARLKEKKQMKKEDERIQIKRVERAKNDKGKEKRQETIKTKQTKQEKPSKKPKKVDGDVLEESVSADESGDGSEPEQESEVEQSNLESEGSDEEDLGIDESGDEKPTGTFVRAPRDSDNEDDEFQDQIASDSEGSVADEDFRNKISLLKSSIPVDEEDEELPKREKKKKVDWKSMPLRNVDRSVGSMTVKRLDLKNITSDTIETVLRHDNTPRTKEEVKAVIPADAFFLGAVVEEDPEAKPESKDNWREGNRFGNNRFGNNRNPREDGNGNRPRKFDKNVDSSFVRLGGKGPGRPKGNWPEQGKKFEKKPAKFENRSERRVAVKPAPVEENLHPSWAAKRKQKEVSLESFQGKKIKFDED